MDGHRRFQILDLHGMKLVLVGFHETVLSTSTFGKKTSLGSFGITTDVSTQHQPMIRTINICTYSKLYNDIINRLTGVM